MLIGSDAGEGFDPNGGADTIDGGAGWDNLMYQLASGLGGTAGIAVQFSTTVAGSGTVVDPWGDTDVFSNIETVRGTEFVDSFIGGLGDQQFRGYKARILTTAARIGIWSRYSDDANYGGTAGVVVDLSTTDAAGFASATDGFGDIDLLRNIEIIIGTGASDVIIGNGADNDFYARAGDDTIAGGAGPTTSTAALATTIWPGTRAPTGSWAARGWTP